MRIWLATASMLALISVASATTYHVGATETYKTLGSVTGLLQPGDVVDVDSGVYHEVDNITCNGTVGAPITIQGVGPTQPIFDATGLSVTGVGSTPRAILQITGANIVVDNLELENARNGNNGSGIRLLNSTNALIENCKISYCDMGVMGNDLATAHFDFDDVGFNGTPDYNGYSHNFYMNGNGGISVYGCYIHDALYGQNFKSRAHYNELLYNVISNSNEGEVCPVDGGSDTTLANSNMVMIGNVITSKSDRTGNSVKFINFGQDMGGDRNGTLYMYNNTCIAGSSSIGFLDLNAASSAVVAKNNIFYGSNSIVQQWTSGLTVPAAGSNNWLPSTAALPAGWTSCVQGPAPGFLSGTTDTRLSAGSACIDQGTGGLYYVDGNGVQHSVSATMSPFANCTVFPRLTQGPTDIGAYEYITTPSIPGDANGDGKVDGADYTIWADHFGETNVPPWLDGGAAYGNFNDDTVVDAADYAIWQAAYGQVAAGEGVPEPACLTALALGGLAALRRK